MPIQSEDGLYQALEADHYYQRPVDVAQLVICDRNGIFPWEPGFDHEHMDRIQPLLFEMHS